MTWWKLCNLLERAAISPFRYEIHYELLLTVLTVVTEALDLGSAIEHRGLVCW